MGDLQLTESTFLKCSLSCVEHKDETSFDLSMVDIFTVRVGEWGFL